MMAVLIHQSVLQERMAQPRTRRAAAGRSPDALNMNQSSTTSTHKTAMPTQAAAMADPALDRLADRCAAMAEALNQRGELSLAVPFYRQAMALLMARRDRATGTRPQPLAPDPAGLALIQEVDALQGDAVAAAGSGSLPQDLREHLRALGDELCLANAASVQAVLRELQQELPSPESELLGLLAKTHLLQGDLASALDHYQQALQLDPEEPRWAVNGGAAWLACGDHVEALRLLRPWARRLVLVDDPTVLRALLGNLALAELQAGHVMEAARLRADLVGLAPDDVPVMDWIEDARLWAESGCHEEAKTLLMALRAVYPRHAALLQLLAETLEACGEYRDAALVYRDLLRPALSGG